MGTTLYSLTLALLSQCKHDWTNDEITILLRSESEQITLTEVEKATLQQILQESLDISQPNFDARQAIENIRKNFEGKPMKNIKGKQPQPDIEMITKVSQNDGTFLQIIERLEA
ncbi:655_t:CDS:2 [Gigaspora rosea]|nr:655_t:CDS:2 [Gigaspora rosea]